MLSAILLCLTTGAAVGFLNGLLGMGGAFIIVPALGHILRGIGADGQTAQLMAIGSAPAAMFLTCVASFRTHCKLGNVDYPILRRLAGGCAVGSIAGACLAPHLSVVYLEAIFGLLCVCMGSLMVLAPSFADKKENLSHIGIAGAFFGLLASLTGLAGTLVCLTWLNWRGVDWRKAVGASSGLGLVTTLVITIAYIVSGWSRSLPFGSLGFVWMPGVFLIMLTGGVTAILGAKLLAWKKLPIKAMKKAVGAILLLIALRLLLIQFL